MPHSFVVFQEIKVSVVRSLITKHRTVNAVDAGSIPVGPPKTFEAVAERLLHFAVYEDDDGSSPFGLASFYWTFS